MPINHALLVVYKSLYVVQESIRAVDLALDNNPPPDEALELNEQRTDLETLKDELQAMRDAVENGTVCIPPPDPSLMSHLRSLVGQVESATQAGSASVSAISLAREVLSTGLAVMSLAHSSS
jgi:hypothetical protein